MAGPARFFSLIFAFASVATAASAADPRPPIHARRASAHISVDGRLDEAAWAEAPVFDQFVETFPKEGAAPPDGFGTEAKVLYDDEFLYVAVRSLDPQPDLVKRQLSRRDTIATSDFIEVALDPTHAGHTGYDFIVNAAGVQRDLLLYGDVSSTDTWDAVWDGNARVDATGWTAELAIPLRVLRFPHQENQTWGIAIRRMIPRTHQTFDSAAIPRNASSASQGGLVVSRFGTLVELVGLKPTRDVELTPYAAARLGERPQYSDPTRPTPTLLDPSVDVGLDLKLALTSSLNLSAAINPDFGQVEADQLIQNVGTNEPFFPEKRPFFTQGLDLFQGVGAEYGVPEQLFYSRRIGLDAPILGAVKLSGSLREGTDVGVLDAVVMGAANPNPSEDNPDRRWGFHLAQPLHFGPNDALPAEKPITRNAFAAVIRQHIAQGATVGGMFTSALPLEAGSFGANAAALDWDLRRGDWGFFGQVDASQAVGGPPEGRLMRDGTVLKDGDLGHGFYFRAGKLGGEPLRFDINGTFMDPKLDLNALGYQQFSNYQWYDFTLHFIRPNGFGPFHSVKVDYTFDQFNWSTDGRWIPRGANHFINTGVVLPSFDSIYVTIGYENPQYDLKEVSGPTSTGYRATGLGFQRAADGFIAVEFDSDSNRPLFGGVGFVVARSFGEGNIPSGVGYQGFANLTWHPMPNLETFLAVEGAYKEIGPRFVAFDESSPNSAFFGDQTPSFFSATLRQQVVLTPRLTLQAYAQLFSGVVLYRHFYGAALDRGDRISLQDLTPTNYTGDPNAHFSQLNVNLVARWEYRLGSTLYLVYTRSHQELPPSDGVASTSVLPSRLLKGPMDQTLLVKWSYWWDV